MKNHANKHPTAHAHFKRATLGDALSGALPDVLTPARVQRHQQQHRVAIARSQSQRAERNRPAGPNSGPNRRRGYKYAGRATSITWRRDAVTGERVPCTRGV